MPSCGPNDPIAVPANLQSVIKTHCPKCSCLRAKIEGFSTRRSQTGEVCVMYRIVVGKGENPRMWQVYRRYSEFQTLHEYLTKHLPPAIMALIKLPGKRHLRKFFEENSNQMKQERLDCYLQTLLSLPATRDYPALFKFLEVYKKNTAEDFIQVAQSCHNHLPQYTATRLFAEFIEPKYTLRPPSCRSMVIEQYRATLASTVASATNPQIRMLQKEAHEERIEFAKDSNDVYDDDQYGQLRFLTHKEQMQPVGHGSLKHHEAKAASAGPVGGTIGNKGDDNINYPLYRVDNITNASVIEPTLSLPSMDSLSSGLSTMSLSRNMNSVAT